MSKHLSDGQLRAADDGEIGPAERRHLEVCEACRTRSSAVQAQAERVASRLVFLAPAPEDPSRLPGTALARFNERTRAIRSGSGQERREQPAMKRLLASRAVRVGVAAALVLALLLAIPATRSLAGRFLSLFRVQQVAVLPLDLTGIQRLSGSNTLGTQVSELLASSVTITQKPGSPIPVATAAEASRLAGFGVRLPLGMTPADIYVEQAAAFRFRVDRAKAQAVLDAAGRRDLILPTAIDGAEISVAIPAGVTATYGVCPEEESDDAEKAGGALTSRRYADCYMMAEFPSPTVQAPAEIEIDQLARIALEFGGMTAEQAASLVRTVDWTSTLVVPIPGNAAYRTVQVDGVTGTLIERSADDSPQFVVIWVKGGIIYAISGLGVDADAALRMADSLP